MERQNNIMKIFNLIPSTPTHTRGGGAKHKT